MGYVKPASQKTRGISTSAQPRIWPTRACMSRYHAPSGLSDGKQKPQAAGTRPTSSAPKIASSSAVMTTVPAMPFWSAASVRAMAARRRL